MKHIVFILGSYYPSYSAVGRCLGNIADIYQNEYIISVICMKTKTTQKSIDKFDKQNIIRVSNKNYDKILLNNYRIENSTGIIKNIFIFNKFILRVKGLIRTVLSKNTLDNIWIDEYLKAIMSIDIPIDVLISTCNPMETTVASIRYKKLINENVVILPYLFDLFADNTKLNRLKLNMLIKRNNNLKIEKEMLEYSKKIFHVANWTKYFRNNFPEYISKTREVEHPLLKLNLNNNIEVIDKRLKLFYYSKDNIEFNKIFEIFSKINLEVLIYCYINSDNEYTDIKVNNCTIKIYNKKQKNTLKKIINEGFSVLSVYNEDSTFMNRRILEYIFTGKPILHIYNSDNKDVGILNNYANKLLLNEDLVECIESYNRFFSYDNYRILSFKKITDYYIDNINIENYINISDFYDTNDIYNLTFAGSLLRNYVEPSYLLKLFCEDDMQNFNINFYSAGSACIDIENCKKENINLIGWISHNKLVEKYSESDAFISIAEKNGKQISSKIFEYMSYGKPIIHIYYSDNDVNLPYLDEYSNSLCIKADISDINFNKKLISLFMKYRRDVKAKNFNGTILEECTPNYIASIIRNEFETER